MAELIFEKDWQRVELGHHLL